MLLQDHLLLGASTPCQFFEFQRQFCVWREQGSSVRGAVSDVHLECVQNDQQHSRLHFAHARSGRWDNGNCRNVSKLTTSPFASRNFFKTWPMTAREDLRSEMARRP